MASVVGDVMYEAWVATDVPARNNSLNEAIGKFFQSIGVDENVAYVMIAHAVFIPLLYGVPTGVVFPIMLHTIRKTQTNARPSEGELGKTNR